MKYHYLTEDDQQAYLVQRLRQLEAEHYAQKVSMDILVEAGEGEDADQVKQHRQALATLDRAYTGLEKRRRPKGENK